ncbi:BspA family leucine-rich repeat surface protein [Mycoplasma cottewii]|uniref:BspA family leucine-rich repeat surface protein n=1 Tax=Mycoplasma cottewii TaxID=51364 RepID=A0ABY5TWW9_9MOLU|nr:BspA family leucine-rich repeat surface protein [Mycoplasma cottewii]UWD34844.1 BspA family leucine-rich repeat surface protein [Mycoplasma cottewii]
MPEYLPWFIQSLDSAFLRNKFSSIKNLEKWDVSNIIVMNYTFRLATKFNHPIGNWNVSNVRFMRRTFAGAQGFRQNISKWNVVGDVKTFAFVTIKSGNWTEPYWSNNTPQIVRNRFTSGITPGGFDRLKGEDGSDGGANLEWIRDA